MIFNLIIYSSVFIGSVTALSYLLKGPIFVPTDKNSLGNMLKLANVKIGEKVIDLGSGDGRVVIAFAKAGAEAHGFEHDPFLVWYSKRRIKKAGLLNNAFIHRKNFWKEDFSKYDVIAVFGISRIMDKLEKKLEAEAKPGTRIVANLFTLPTWKSTAKLGGVYLYVR